MRDCMPLAAAAVIASILEQRLCNSLSIPITGEYLDDELIKSVGAPRARAKNVPKEDACQNCIPIRRAKSMNAGASALAAHLQYPDA